MGSGSILLFIFEHDGTQMTANNRIQKHFFMALSRSDMEYIVYFNFLLLSGILLYISSMTDETNQEAWNELFLSGNELCVIAKYFLRFLEEVRLDVILFRDVTSDEAGLQRARPGALKASRP